MQEIRCPKCNEVFQAVSYTHLGVKTAETGASAKSKCRGLVIVPPHFEEYLRYSRLARKIYERYTDLIEPFGMDECWLDISGTRRLFGAPEKVADEIRRTVKEELCLLYTSIRSIARHFIPMKVIIL